MSSPHSNLNHQRAQPQPQLQTQQKQKQDQNQIGFPGLHSNLANLATGAAAGAAAGGGGQNGFSSGDDENRNRNEAQSFPEINQTLAPNNSNVHGNRSLAIEAQQASSSSSSNPLEPNPNFPVFNANSSNSQSKENHSSSSGISANGKARQLDRYLDFDELMAQTEEVPLELLEAEVAPVDEEVIPLNAIVLRMANYGYENIQNLTETLPSLSSDEKRRKIFQSALDMRKQFIKLLVLSRWSKYALDLQKARDLIGLMMEQNTARWSATQALHEFRQILPGSRLRNYDLSTAIDVLSSGNYLRLPSSIKDEIVPQKPYTDEEALEIVAEVEDALRLRLSCGEVLPIQMSHYSISNGRALFHVKGLFDASVTLSGSTDQDRFYLLSIKFDFRNTGLGKEKYKRSLEKVDRDRIISDGDFHLTPRSPAADRSDETELRSETVDAVAAGEIPDPERMELDADLTGNKVGEDSLERKDAPLLRLFSYLQDTSLKYQLSILEYQAKQLAALHWGSNLRVSMEADPVTLVIKYWTRNSSHVQRPIASNSRTSRGQAQPLWNPVAEGTLRISIQEKEAQNGTSQTIESLLGSAVVSGAGAGAGANLRKHFRMTVSWDLDDSVVNEVDHSLATIDSYNLNIESLLTSVISQHSSAAIEAFHNRILSSSLGQALDSNECAIEKTIRQDGSTSSVLRIKLYDTFSVVLGLTPLSGRLFLRSHLVASETKDVVASDGTARLAEATERINSNPSALVEVLQTLRFGGVMAELEQKADYLGLSCMRRVPLRSEDRAKFFGSSPSALLFIPLQQCPSYFIVPRISAQNITVALVCIAPVIEPSGQQNGLVQFISWIDRPRVSGRGKRKRSGSNFTMKQDISIEELSRLHSYCIALVGYLQIEEQLRLRGVPYFQVPASKSYVPANPNQKSSSNPVEDVASIVPSLCVLSKGLLGHTSGLSNPNVSISLCDWWIPSKCHVKITLQLRLRSGVMHRSLTCEDASEIHFDNTKSVLTFSTKSVGDCVHRFLVHWNEISKIALLAREISHGCGKRKKGLTSDDASSLNITLKSFDLSSVQFTYDSNLSVIVKRHLSFNSGQPSFGRFVLCFASEGQEPLKTRRKANPHHLLTHSFERVLNNNDDSTSHFWSGFLLLLHQTLPILREIAPFYDQALEDPDCPELEIFSATWYRLRLLDRYAIDVRLISDFRVLLSDASMPGSRTNQGQDHLKNEISTSKSTSQLSSSSPGNISSSNSELYQSIPNFQKIASRVNQEFNFKLNDGGEQEMREDEAGRQQYQNDKGRKIMLLDLRTALLCSARDKVVRPVLRSLLDQVKEEIHKL